MRLTSKGQVTIPQEIREKLGLYPGTEIEFDTVADEVRIRKAGSQTRRAREVRAWLDRLRGSASNSRVRLTTDEIMALTRGED
jgi:AbrB family looped-hinge helix DNA binding protein